MNNTMKLLALAAALALPLSGCGFLKQKAAGYYLNKARAVTANAAAGAADLAAAFDDLGKAAEYAPDSDGVVEALDQLAAAAEKAGFARGAELQPALLRKMLEAYPRHWSARSALINFLADRGDLAGLADEALAAGKLAADKDPGVQYSAKLVELDAIASAVPWLESEAFVNLNKSADLFFEKTSIYASAVDKVAAIKGELEKQAAADPALKAAAPQQLASAAEIASSEVLRDAEGIGRANDFLAKVKADEQFKTAVHMCIRGNSQLAAKDYQKARVFFQAAIARYPALADARRQLAETDFQEGAALAAVGDKGKAPLQLLDRAYANAAAAAESAGPLLPFVKKDKFTGESWALKAAVISARRALLGAKLRKAAQQEAEFKAALEESMKLNPEGRLARDLNERYLKEGF